MSLGSLTEDDAEERMAWRGSPRASSWSRRGVVDRWELPERDPSNHPRPEDARCAGELDQEPPPTAEHLRSGLEHRLLHAAQVPAVGPGVFELTPDHGDQVVREKRHQEADFVFLDAWGGEVREDCSAELPDAVLEGAPAAVVGEDLVRALLVRRPARHQEEMAREQFQLPCFGIGLVDDDEDHPVAVVPRLGLVRNDVDDLLVALFGRTSLGSAELRLCQAIKDGVVAQAADETDARGGEHVKDLSLREGGVEANVESVGEGADGSDRLAQEGEGLGGGVDRARAQAGVDEAVAETRGVEVPTMGEAGDEGVVDLLRVVAMVLGSLLGAEDLDGEAVHVERGALERSPTGAGQDMATNPAREGLAEDLAVLGVVGEGVGEPR